MSLQVLSVVFLLSLQLAECKASGGEPQEAWGDGAGGERQRHKTEEPGIPEPLFRGESFRGASE